MTSRKKRYRQRRPDLYQEVLRRVRRHTQYHDLLDTVAWLVSEANTKASYVACLEILDFIEGDSNF